MKTIINIAVRKKKSLLKLLDKVKVGGKIPERYEYYCALDLSNHIKLYDLIITKKFKRAANLFEDMDTSSRDEIPEAIGLYLEDFT